MVKISELAQFSHLTDLSELLNSHNYMNRELSWLAFNDRVLALASDEKTPLFERINFLTIVQKNFDEWFMVRIGSLISEINAGKDKEDPSGLTPEKQQKILRRAIKAHMKDQAKVYKSQLLPALAGEGISILSVDELSEEDKKAAETIFKGEIFPKLEIQRVKHGAPFPFIPSGRTSALVTLMGRRSLINVSLPAALPHLIQLPQSQNFVRTTSLIKLFISAVLPNQAISAIYFYRVLRDGQLEDLAKDASDVVAGVKNQIRARDLAPIINLTVAASMPAALKNRLSEKLKVEEHYIFRTKQVLDYSILSAIPDSLSAGKFDRYRYIKRQSYHNPELSAGRIFASLDKKDFLLHHPYDSFDDILNLFSAAAADDKVSEISISLYRVAHNSKLIESLKKAALSGKKVTILMEIKARFDEAHNLQLAEELKAAGAKVYTSFPNMKVHTKMAVIRRGRKLYTHLSTGNYNETSAHFYEDLGFLTSRNEYGRDVLKVMDFVTLQKNRPRRLKEIQMAPNMLRQTLNTKIAAMVALAQKGQKPQIWIKANSLSDKDLIERLYIASQAGVHIHLLIRGIATAKVNKDGVSDNIQIHSILGRFLEHSRVYLFKKSKDDVEVFLSSADVMPRNLDKRVELLFPIKDDRLVQEIRDILRSMWHDRAQTFYKGGAGKYFHRKMKASSNRIPIQERFLIAAEKKELAAHGDEK